MKIQWITLTDIYLIDNLPQVFHINIGMNYITSEFLLM